MRCARLARSDNALLELREVSRLPDPNPVKGVYWLPCPVVPPPSYDQAVEVRAGPDYRVEATEVVESWTVRLKTQAELDADIEAAKEADVSAAEALNTIFKALFFMANEIRALKGQAALTRPQFRNFLKNL